MGTISSEKTFGLKIRESADDGSDFGTPDADYRFLFVGEDGDIHLKDSADAVTDFPAGGGAGGGGSGILARVVYDPGSDTTYTTTSATYADVDATNLAIPSFDFPSSGVVDVEVDIAVICSGAASRLNLNLRDTSGDIAGTDVVAHQTSSTSVIRSTMRLRLSGTPAATKADLKLGYARTSGTTTQLQVGPTLGPGMITVRESE